MNEAEQTKINKLVKSSQDLLRTLSVVNSLISDLPDQSVASVHSQIHRREMDAIDHPQNRPADARMELHISQDGMRCTASLFPQIGGGALLDMRSIQEMIVAKGITYGVNYDAVQNAINKCNTEGVKIDDVVVAQGREPVPSIREHLLLVERFREPKVAIEPESIRIDHKDRSPFLLVKQGELLAKRIPSQEGAPGWDIFGGELSAPHGQVPKIVPAENVTETAQGFVAAIDGRFLFEGRAFSVTAVLDVPGDVDYSTGNIDFDGDVLVGGEVREGFSLKASGSVFCAKTVSAGTVECGKNLIVRLGIIGRQDGNVKVKGEIRCKYIEHCSVEAGGSIQSFVGAMNSIINTNATFETGTRGIIVGGSIHAQDGVVATQVGTEMGPATEIYCGLDYSVLERVEWIRDRNVELANKLLQVQQTRRSRGDPTGTLMTLETKLRQAIRRLNDASMTLVSHLDQNEEAKVVIRGTIFPNTYIEICHASFVVGRVMHKVTFRLDRERGKVAVE